MSCLFLMHIACIKDSRYGSFCLGSRESFGENRPIASAVCEEGCSKFKIFLKHSLVLLSVIQSFRQFFVSLSNDQLSQNWFSLSCFLTFIVSFSLWMLGPALLVTLMSFHFWTKLKDWLSVFINLNLLLADDLKFSKFSVCKKASPLQSWRVEASYRFKTCSFICYSI